MRFVSFHTHSTYSYGDGYGTVKEHVRRASSLGMCALALSEHGNVNSHVALEREAMAAGIKPIFGIEAYFGPVSLERRSKRKFHITLFAMDDEGYRNLNRIVTQSYKDFYQFPTVSAESLKKYAKGVVAFSGCSDSFISCSLLGGKTLGEKRLDYNSDQSAQVRRRLGWFTDVFEDRFYLEVQRFPQLDRTRVLNPAFAALSRDTGIPLIATADVHYPRPEQNELQKVLHAARRKSSVAVADAEWEYSVKLTYPLSDEEIIDDLVGTGLSSSSAVRAVENTENLADRCNVELPKARPLRFSVPGPTDWTARQYLWVKLREGWTYRCSQRPNIAIMAKEYNARLKHEMKIIADKDFCDYFLVVSDLVKWAKDNDITVGPGRGSAAGSLVCYILGITEIDPLHPVFNRMVFERFIDPTRSDMPDVDLDFDDELRHLVFERAREIYGSDNVANVGNHIKYRGRRALQDVARAYVIPLKTFEAISERILDRTETDDRVDSSIEDVVDSYQGDPNIGSLLSQYPDQIRQAIAFEGNQHSMGTHAGGFVIGNPIPEVCAIYAREDKRVIPYDKRDAEYLGMLKIDFLGLSAMGMLGLCRQWTGINLEDLYCKFYRDYALKGEDSYDILRKFCEDDVTGIFQYEGGTTRTLLRRVQPATFDHLAAVGALSRPGPYHGGQADAYVAVKNGETQMELIHPSFDKHVEWTYGQIVYQEQIMWILRDLAGFNTERVLRVRKIIGKKLGEHQFAALWDEFKTGCANNGVSEVSARKVWSGITTAAGYAFNVPHAYSYALDAWLQMWFKVYHPTVFFAASLAKNGDDKDNISRRTALLKDAEFHSIKIAPFDPNFVKTNWYPTMATNVIHPGLRQIPGIGLTTAEAMYTWRNKDGDPWSVHWEDFEAVKGVGKVTVQNIKDFVSKEDPFNIRSTEKQLLEFRRQLNNGDFSHTDMPHSSSFYTSNNLCVKDHDNESYVAWVGLVNNVVYRDEIESIRAKTGQSITDIRSNLDNPELTKKATLFAYDEFGEIALRVSRWRFGVLRDKIAAIKTDHHVVVVWGRVFENRGGSIQVQNLWVLDPD